jgi:hypothetical protein
MTIFALHLLSACTVSAPKSDDTGANRDTDVDGDVDPTCENLGSSDTGQGDIGDPSYAHIAAHLGADAGGVFAISSDGVCRDRSGGEPAASETVASAWVIPGDWSFVVWSPDASMCIQGEWRTLEAGDAYYWTLGYDSPPFPGTFDPVTWACAM